jgi:hypothetical protein
MATWLVSSAEEAPLRPSRSQRLRFSPRYYQYETRLSPEVIPAASQIAAAVTRLRAE